MIYPAKKVLFISGRRLICRSFLSSFVLSFSKPPYILASSWKINRFLLSRICFSTSAYLKNRKGQAEHSSNSNNTSNMPDQYVRRGGYIEEILAKKDEGPKTTAEKVKKKAENTLYYVAAAMAVAAISAVSYFIFLEFFTFKSPHRIYTNSFKIIKNDDRCLELFGSNISAHGEHSGRGRRKLIANHSYVEDGESRIRVSYHVKGERTAGRAHAEIANVKQKGTWQFRLLIAESNSHPRQRIILIDNR